MSHPFPPELSVVIPAFNEERLLGATLTSVRESLEACHLSESAEVIVVDNNSSDRTGEIAQDHGARVVFEPVNQISRARNAGGRAACGEYLVFLDADTLLNGELLGSAIANLRAGDCCGGGVVIQMDKEVSFAMQTVIAGWNFVAKKMKLAAGCFIYCLRDGFEATGGFSEKVYAGEELWFSLALRKWGKKRRLSFQIIADATIYTSNRKVEWYTPWQMIRQLAVVLLFPFATRSRRFCGIWYQRPHEN